MSNTCDPDGPSAAPPKGATRPDIDCGGEESLEDRIYGEGSDDLSLKLRLTKASGLDGAVVQLRVVVIESRVTGSGRYFGQEGQIKDCGPL